VAAVPATASMLLSDGPQRVGGKNRSGQGTGKLFEIISHSLANFLPKANR
jgi:hypothetical protein